MAFRDFAFQAGLRDDKIVYDGLYFRRPSGAKFFAELGSDAGFYLDRSVSKDHLLRVVRDAGMELRDRGDRIELDSGVNMSFDESALDSIQVGAPRVRGSSRP